ncbi:MAG: hypothetical protein H5T86_08005, partial [Armatimonadetes bacterium]|nr:hypothetical protein [Armatimonadota bacterium]
ERHVDRPYPLWHIENHFGIVHVDNTPKPAYKALQALYSQLDSDCKSASGVPVEFRVTRPSRDALDAQPKWFLYEDMSGEVPVRKLVFWYPVPAKDNFQPALADISVGNATATGVPITDAPQILRVHKVDERWGWPVLIDPLRYQMLENISWTIGAGSEN